jgi:multicomponent K+:H+ antiporter subunit F
MIELATDLAIAAFACAILLNLYRLVRGPSPLDRVLALDTLYVNSIGMILLLGIAESTTVYFPAALVIAAVGFIATAAFAKYLGRGRVIG